MILTPDLVKQTITDLTPAIAAILKRHGDRNLFTTVEVIGDIHLALFRGWIVQDETEDDFTKYIRYAKAKHSYTVRTGKCSREASLDGAHLVREEDMIWPGSVNWNDLVVSSSGADDGMVDEGISNMIAAAIIMECQVAVNKLRATGTCIYKNP